MTTLVTRREEDTPTVVIPQFASPKLRKYRPDLQGLRAVAIMMVVFLHTGLVNIHGGVDLSLILSGFLIARNLLKQIESTGRIKWGEFWASRFRRLAPGMTIVIITTAVFAWIYAAPLKFHGYMMDAVYAAFSSLNWRLAAQGTDYFNHKAATPYQHLWSLGIEEQFYIVFPALLLALVWVSKKLFRNRKLVGIMLTGIIGISFYLSVTITNLAEPWAYFGLHTRAWEFTLGALLALAAERLSRMPEVLAAVLSWAGLATIIVTGMLITDNTPLPGYAIAGPVVGAAMVIAAGCANPRGGAEWLLKRFVFNLVGTVSYGWYLWHWPLLILWPDIVGTPMTTGNQLRVIGVSFFLSVIMYYGVERRVRENKRLVKIPRRGITLGAGLLALTAGLLVIALVIPLNIAATTGTAQEHTTGTPAVKAAVGLRALPSNLQPSLVDAPKDLTQHGCIGSIEATKVNVTANCIVGGTTAAKTVVVFGDSHAWQWGDTFDAVGQQLGFRVVTLTKSGCSPGQYAIKNPQLDREYTECDTWRDSAISAIATMHPQVVVLTGRTRQEATRSGMEATMRRLQATGAKLVFLTDAPHPGIDVPDCLAKHTTDASACNRSLGDAVEFPDHRQMEAQVAKSFGATVIDVLPWFCTNLTCPPVIGGRVVYFDDSHLTSTYSLALAPDMELALAGVVS